MGGRSSLEGVEDYLPSEVDSEAVHSGGLFSDLLDPHLSPGQDAEPHLSKVARQLAGPCVALEARQVSNL